MGRTRTRPTKLTRKGRTASQQDEPTRPGTAKSGAPANEPLPPEGTPPAENQVDTASIDSFPCSDPPGYYSSHC